MESKKADACDVMDRFFKEDGSGGIQLLAGNGKAHFRMGACWLRGDRSLKVARSWLQKAIRRSNVQQAVAAFMEMALVACSDSTNSQNKALFTRTMNRIRVCSVEDIHDPVVIPVVHQKTLHAEAAFAKLGASPMLHDVLPILRTIVSALELLCAANKLRLISFLKTALQLPPFYDCDEDAYYTWLPRLHEAAGFSCAPTKKWLGVITEELSRECRTRGRAADTRWKAKSSTLDRMVAAMTDVAPLLHFNSYKEADETIFNPLIWKVRAAGDRTLVGIVSALQSITRRVKGKEQPIFSVAAVLACFRGYPRELPTVPPLEKGIRAALEGPKAFIAWTMSAACSLRRDTPDYAMDIHAGGKGEQASLEFFARTASLVGPPEKVVEVDPKLETMYIATKLLLDAKWLQKPASIPSLEDTIAACKGEPVTPPLVLKKRARSDQNGDMKRGRVGDMGEFVRTGEPISSSEGGSKLDQLVPVPYDAAIGTGLPSGPDSADAIASPKIDHPNDFIDVERRNAIESPGSSVMKMVNACIDELKAFVQGPSEEGKPRKTEFYFAQKSTSGFKPLVAIFPRKDLVIKGPMEPAKVDVIRAAAVMLARPSWAPHDTLYWFECRREEGVFLFSPHVAPSVTPRFLVWDRVFGSRASAKIGAFHGKSQVWGWVKVKDDEGEFGTMAERTSSAWKRGALSPLGFKSMFVHFLCRYILGFGDAHAGNALGGSRRKDEQLRVLGCDYEEQRSAKGIAAASTIPQCLGSKFISKARIKSLNDAVEEHRGFLREHFGRLDCTGLSEEQTKRLRKLRTLLN